MVSKKPVFDELVNKVNAIDIKILSTSGLATNIKYDWNKQGIEEKIEDVDKNITNSRCWSQKGCLQHINYRNWKEDTLYWWFS